MKKQFIKNLFTALSCFILIIFTSCDEVEDIEVGGTSVEEMSGDWWIIALEPDGVTPAYGGDYVQFTTNNTAADDGTMWIDDHKNWMEIKTRVNTNVNELSFSGEDDAIETYYDGTVNLKNGKISKKSYTTESNTLVDEIYFEVEFDWAAGTVFQFKGHKRTGFAEDENPHF